MTAPYPFESRARTAVQDAALVRATIIAVGFAVAGTVAFSTLIALSHAVQGKDPSLGGTLIRRGAERIPDVVRHPPGRRLE